LRRAPSQFGQIVRASSVNFWTTSRPSPHSVHWYWYVGTGSAPGLALNLYECQSCGIRAVPVHLAVAQPVWPSVAVPYSAGRRASTAVPASPGFRGKKFLLWITQKPRAFVSATGDPGIRAAIRTRPYRRRPNLRRGSATSKPKITSSTLEKSAPQRHRNHRPRHHGHSSHRLQHTERPHRSTQHHGNGHQCTPPRPIPRASRTRVRLMQRPSTRRIFDR